MSNLDAKFRLKDDNGFGLTKNNFRNSDKSAISSFLPVRATSTNLPTISNSTSSSISSPIVTAYNSVSLKRNAELYSWSNSGLGAYGVLGSISASNLARNLTIQFYSDALSIEFHLLEYNTRAEIRVDSDIVEVLSLTSSGQPYVKKYVWSDRKVRLYEITGYNMPFRQIVTDANASVIYPNDLDEKIQLLWFGDSYTQGTGANSARQTFAGVASDVLGLEFLTDGVGSMGWNSASPNDVLTRANKYLPTLNKQVTHIVTAYGYNDSGGDMTALANNYAIFVTQARIYNPEIKIITLSPWTPLGTLSGLTTVKQTLQQACITNNTTFLDIENIVNVSNKQIYTGVDNVHANTLGHLYLGQRIAMLLRSVL